jgi:5-methylcytosine-specific restriction endonuclease McrA
MRTAEVPKELAKFIRHLQHLRADRETVKQATKWRDTKPRALTFAQRMVVLSKTAGRCHICGGSIRGPWQADHILARSGGGKSTVDNYLPAHAMCNNYRWNYLPKEFQEILRMGVWLRTQVETRTRVGLLAGGAYIAGETRKLQSKK